MAVVGEQPCPICAELIPATDRICPYCGECIGEDDADVPYPSAREIERTGTARTLLLTGLTGCMSPIFVVYGVWFLWKNRDPFPGKCMAISGVIIHCCWTAFAVALLLLALSAEYQQ